MRTIKNEWESYKKDVLKGVTNPVQLIETRRGYYAGACGLMALIMDASASEINENEGAEILDVLFQEINQFSIDVRDGKK